MISSEILIEDLKILSAGELIHKYLGHYEIEIVNILNKIKTKSLIIILIVCKYDLDLNTFIKNNNEFIKIIFTPNDLSNEQIKFAFISFYTTFNMFIDFDFISISDKEKYLIKNFVNTGKTNYRNITEMYNFVIFIKSISNEIINSYIIKYGLQKFTFIMLLFNYTKDFKTEGLSIFSFTGNIYKEFPLLIKNLINEESEGIVANFLNNQLNIKNEGIHNEIVKCIENVFKYLNDDIKDVKNLLITLCNYFNYNKLSKLIESITPEIDQIDVENCNEIYNEFEINDNFGSFNKGCCYDINGIKCKNYQVSDGFCLCNNETLKKYLKYKRKYLLLKNKLN